MVHRYELHAVACTSTITITSTRSDMWSGVICIICMAGVGASSMDDAAGVLPVASHRPNSTLRIVLLRRGRNEQN